MLPCGGKRVSSSFFQFIELLLKSESDSETIEKSTTDDGYIVRKLSTEEIVGSALIFFVGGVDTVSSRDKTISNRTSFKRLLTIYSPRYPTR